MKRRKAIIRAALGLAGVAIQAGARSAIATLWRVADEATAVLMRALYQHLRTPGVSRAQALQQAQLTLLKEPRYAGPFFWAPFLLLNNWLLAVLHGASGRLRLMALCPMERRAAMTAYGYGPYAATSGASTG